MADEDNPTLAALRRAAQRGEAAAQCLLGQMYEEGNGVERNDGEALTCYRKAAEQGNAAAQLRLGWMLLEGRGAEKDESKAFAWWHKAAKGGHARAQSNLAWLYKQGRGVTKDLSLAKEWYRKAAAQGDARAREEAGADGQQPHDEAVTPISTSELFQLQKEALANEIKGEIIRFAKLWGSTVVIVLTIFGGAAGTVFVESLHKLYGGYQENLLAKEQQFTADMTARMTTIGRYVTDAQAALAKIDEHARTAQKRVSELSTPALEARRSGAERPEARGDLRTAADQANAVGASRSRAPE